MEGYDSTGKAESEDLLTAMGSREDLECLNSRPGMLTENEDNLNAIRDKLFEEDFFCCEC